ncbi:MAG: CoA-binding protein [Gemmatimonadales bacterium]|nr:CoA-binding protein [Gemmatimonadales bacterium]
MTDRAALRAHLARARTIAVVGLSSKPGRASHEVAGYLQQAGYRIVPVHPSRHPVLGETTYATLPEAAAAIGVPIDIVDVFRRGETIPELVPDLLAVRPALVVLQVGITHPAAEATLRAAGIDVVSDRCLMVDHARLLGDG